MFNSDFHGRRSIRMLGYDYCSPGAYFITICAYKKEMLFGEIGDGKMLLSEVGKILQEEWGKTADIRPEVVLDEFVIMPNHVHGIVWIRDDDCGAGSIGRGTGLISRGTARRAPTDRGPTMERFGRPVTGSIPTIVRSFKSAVTKRINEWNPMFGTVWQRNYYERVIRDDQELQAVRQYVKDNPLKWEDDSERHP